MTRVFDGNELVIATHNEGKLKEIREMLGDSTITFYSAGDLNLEDPEETEDSFIGNAVLKAKASAGATGKVALADDSGLAVDALNGDPGIYSARWAGSDRDRDFDMAMGLVNDKLGDNPNRRAKFVCAMALVWPDGHVETVEGEIYGNLVWPTRGENGMGYDPMFQPDGEERTFGEMSSEEKHSISHRADALQKIIQKCFKQQAA